MTVSAEAREGSLLSVHAATCWLKARGRRPNTPHSIYAAIARGELAKFAVAQRVVLVREDDLAKYAAGLAPTSAKA